MKYSQSGAGHFEDCKPLFNAVYILGFVAFIALAVLSLKKLLSRRLLRLSGVITFVIPFVFSIGVWLNFDKLFVTFHKLFFSNDDWLFDPATDEIITVLPESFFMDCAVLIAICWILASVVQLLCSAATKEK